MCKIIIDGEEFPETTEPAKWSNVKSFIQNRLPDHYYVDYVEIRTNTSSNYNEVYREQENEILRYKDENFQDKMNKMAKYVATNLKEKGLIDNPNKNDL